MRSTIRWYVAGSARRRSVMAVTMGPGWTELHRMPSPAYWSAVNLVRSRTAPLEAWQGGHGGLGPEEDALGVDVHHAIPRLGGGVLEPARPADARVVDEDVEPSEAADRGLDGALPVRLAGDVELDEERLAPLGLDVGLDGLALRLQDVADGDRSAFAREQPSLGCSHAARGAADEGGLARQAHGDQLPGGRYPAPCASSMASKPSSGDMRAEVFRSFTAPLPMIAMETAAALTLLGTSKITTTS